MDWKGGSASLPPSIKQEAFNISLNKDCHSSAMSSCLSLKAQVLDAMMIKQIPSHVTGPIAGFQV